MIPDWWDLPTPRWFMKEEIEVPRGFNYADQYQGQSDTQVLAGAIQMVKNVCSIKIAYLHSKIEYDKYLVPP